MLEHEGMIFAAALQLQEPLYVEKVDFDPDEGELNIYINFKKGGKFNCSVCSLANLPVHDTLDKTWRHLNFFQYKTFLHFRTPRTICPEHGTHLIDVPWAAEGSGFTLLFEALIMTMVASMAVSKVASIVNEHDTRLWRIIKRYVMEAWERADYSTVTQVALDETSSKRRHTYVTIFADINTRRVLYVADGKDAQTVADFVAELKRRNIDPHQVTDFSADMSPAFKKGIAEQFPNAEITADKFHVISLMNTAVDKVRRREARDNSVLKNSRYSLLKNPEKLKESQKEILSEVLSCNLQTARAYRIRLALQDVYDASDHTTAKIFMDKWYSWAIRSRIEEVKKVAKTIKAHYTEILNHFKTQINNGMMEAINSVVQSARSRARGYRNTENFKIMIYLLGGKLDIQMLSVR